METAVFDYYFSPFYVYVRGGMVWGVMDIIIIVIRKIDKEGYEKIFISIIGRGEVGDFGGRWGRKIKIENCSMI